jgi:nucleotide-binding universal stress UspA family protein
MAFPKKVLIAVDSSKSLEILGPIRAFDWLQDADIHLVHVFQLLTYGDGLSFNVAFPFHEDRNQLSEAVVSKLQTSSPQFMPYVHVGKVVYQCLFDEKPKQRILQYVKDEMIDLTIVATRQKKGLFESSFANYLCSHSTSSVMVVKQEL